MQNASFADFDRAMQEDMAIMKGATPDELKTLERVSAEGLVNVETQRFRVDPVMSYVPKEVRAADPAFWMPKRPTAKPTTTTQQQ